MPLEARVKAVLSGDTVVLSHITNPGQERTLSLAYVSAPRLRREGDEVSGIFFMVFLQLLPSSVCLGSRIGGLYLRAPSSNFDTHATSAALTAILHFFYILLPPYDNNFCGNIF